MAEQNFEIRWVKSPDWKMVSATSVAVGALGVTAEGMRIVIHFSSEWADMEKETFVAEVTDPPFAVGIPGRGATGASISAKSPINFHLSPVVKLEEVAVKMPPDAAAILLLGLLAHFQSFSPTLKQSIRTVWAQIANT